MAESTFTLDSEAVRKELSNKGYCVIPNVIKDTECDDLIGQYKTWLANFGDDDFPKHRRSIIFQYRIGHCGASWSARLKVKPVFASIWDTEKLLTSFDSVAISKPPEKTGGPFDTGLNWFHCDQKASRKGLHAYQGALYLEETTEMDHCFRVLSNSHRYHEEFYSHFAGPRRKSLKMEFTKLSKGQTEWYKKRKCEEVKVPVPKGGMVLWDSRTIHDNVPPVLGRPHQDRWRWVVFICMTPAKWATPEAREKRAHAYKELIMTNHWPSQDFIYFKGRTPKHGGDPMFCVDTLPEVAKYGTARLLAGADEYDFEDDESNGPGWDPVWDTKLTQSTE